MATQTGKVLIDTSHLQRDTRRLVSGLTSGGDRVAHDQAFRTTGRVGAATPVRTGALVQTVGVKQVAGGWGVTYGGSLPYAGYIEKRKHPVRKGARGSRTEFRKALELLAGQETRRV